MSNIEHSAASSSASAASNTDIHSSGGASSSNGETSTTGSTNFVRSETEPELVARETKQVRRSKVLFLLLLLIVTVAAGSATYTWAKRDEEQDFEDEFYDVSHEINLASNLNAQHVAEFLNSVSISMTSQAHAQNAVWPNFVASDFEVQGHNFLDSTSADFLIIAPVVTAENRESWEDFSVQNQDWVDNGLEFEGKTLADTTLSPHIHNLVANSSHGNQATYLPFWQASPIPNDIDLINFDSLLQPVINKGFNFVYENNEELLSEIVDLSSFGAKFFDFDEVEHPRSLMMAPVQRNVARHHDDDDDDDEVIAVLLTTARWEIFLRNAIHGGIQGVTLVVSNSCNDIFTYQLNGPDAKFMGFGDLHDSEYDEPHQWIHFEPFTWHTDENNNSTVNCHYSIDVYPSAKMRESFFTNKPAIMTVIVVAVFLLTSLAFMFYDRLVQIRQNKIMDSAQKSNVIVSSLFPAEVRDRLFNKRSKSKKVSRTGHNKAKAIVSVIADGSKVRLKHFLHEDGGHPGVDVDEERHVAEPIADLFPHTTVMFADIAGFTCQ